MTGYEIATIIAASTGFLTTILGFLLAWRNGEKATDYYNSLTAVIRGVNEYSASPLVENKLVKSYVQKVAEEMGTNEKLHDIIKEVESKG